MKKFLALVLIGMLSAAGVLALMSHAKLPFEASSRVLVSCYHLNPIEGYTMVYADESADYAVYVLNEYKAKHVPQGAEVTYLNSRGTVESCDDKMFYVLPSNTNAIVPGVSGAIVYYNDVPVGVISGWDGKGLVRCTFY